MSTGRFALKIGISVSGHVGDDPEHALNKMARYTVCVKSKDLLYNKVFACNPYWFTYLLQTNFTLKDITDIYHHHHLLIHFALILTQNP